MPFMPYLNFPGTCAEAMVTYCRLFGGTELHIMRYSDAPPELCPQGEGPGDLGRDLVMHASFRVRDGVLMASDYPPGMEGAAQAGVSVSLDFPTVAEARAAHDALARDGGEEWMPFGATFWADGFGMVRDRFGTQWMLSSGPREPMRKP